MLPALVSAAICMGTAWGQGLDAKDYRWKHVGIVGGGFVTGIVFHPSEPGLRYARTDIGGAYRWDTKRNRWAALTDFVSMADRNLLGIESIAVDPNDSSRLYLAAGTYTRDWAGNGAIFRSNDQGRSFTRTNLPFQLGANEVGRHAGERLAVDPVAGNNLFFGSRNNGLWTSSDYGETWSSVASFPAKESTNGVGIAFVLFDSHSQAGTSTPVVYVGLSSWGTSIYRSFDRGKTWEGLAGQPTGLLPNHGAISPDLKLYLTYGDQPGPNDMNFGLVWKFDLERGIWTNITPQTPGNGNPYHFGYGGLALDPQHPGTVMVATMDRWYPGDEIFRSTDSGVRWESMSEGATRDDSLSPFLRFGKGGTSFGWWMGAMAVDPHDSNSFHYGTGATIWTSHDLGNLDVGQATHWQVGARGIEEASVLHLVSPPFGDHLLSAVRDLGGFVHQTLRASPAGGMMSNPVFVDTTGLDFAEQNPALAVRVGTGDLASHGAKSTDGGVSWTPFAKEPPGSSTGGSVAIAADGLTIVWSTPNGQVSVSQDGGASWNAVTGLPMSLAVVADRKNPKKFYSLDANNGKIYTSSNAAKSFAVISSVPNGAGTLQAAWGAEGDLWLAAQYAGLFHSTDGGVSFTRDPNFLEAYAVGFGKAPKGSAMPTVFLSGKSSGVQGIFVSTDAGKIWTRINDDQHQYGGIEVLTGDRRVYGRVYLGSNGRGIIEGSPKLP